MLTVGDRVKFSNGYLDCWNTKDSAKYASWRGVVTKDNCMHGKVLWDDGVERGVFFPDLEAE